MDEWSSDTCSASIARILGTCHLHLFGFHAGKCLRILVIVLGILDVSFELRELKAAEATTHGDRAVDANPSFDCAGLLRASVAPYHVDEITPNGIRHRTRYVTKVAVAHPRPGPHEAEADTVVKILRDEILEHESANLGI